MIWIYMVKDKLSEAYYKRGSGYSMTWVEKDCASVWTTRAGASRCVGIIRERNRKGHQHREPEIVTLVAMEPSDYERLTNVSQIPVDAAAT